MRSLRLLPVVLLSLVAADAKPDRYDSLRKINWDLYFESAHSVEFEPQFRVQTYRADGQDYDDWGMGPAKYTKIRFTKSPAVNLAIESPFDKELMTDVTIYVREYFPDKFVPITKFTVPKGSKKFIYFRVGSDGSKEEITEGQFKEKK